jgi:uncharacterized protein YjbI with pentapeptide repeats
MVRWLGKYLEHIMDPVCWLRQHRTPIAIGLGILALIVVGIWFWGVLVGYVKPGAEGSTSRKDVVQAFALIAAGVVGLIGGIVGIANLSVSRQNLEQQISVEEQRREAMRDLENQRTQEAALQAFFEQMGGLLTDQNLINTDREDVRQLAQAQSHTVLARLDGPRRGGLLRFLHVAGLISTEKTIVGLSGANLHGADLQEADLHEANLHEANLREADLQEADLSGANLHEAHLSGAKLGEADLRGAYLSSADLGGADLHGADLRGAYLSSADLGDATLTGADLREADLHEVDLRGADLRGAHLSSDHLSEAEVVKLLTEATSLLGGATMPDGQLYKQ